MRTVKLTGIRQMAMFELPVPRIKDDKDVLIKMTHVGVCGSDVHYYTTGRIGSQIVQYPFTVGHECAGIVEKVGVAVTRVKPGDRIAVEPATACYQCDQCLAGRPHTCRKLTFLGCPGQVEGCLSDYILMKEESCYPIPEQMTLEEAALSEPLSIGLYAVKLSIPMRHARIGIPEVDRIAFSMDNMRRKEICIQNVRRRNHCVQAALDMIAGKLCDVNIMTTHRFPLERAQEALYLVESYLDGVVKAMIEI